MKPRDLGWFYPNSYARCFLRLVLGRTTPLKAKLIGPNYKHGWIHIYQGTRKVGSCNPTFFKAHYVKKESK